MNKQLLAALLILGAAVSFTSCNQNKTQEVDEENAIVLTDSLKEEAKELLRTVQVERMALMSEIEVTDNGVRLVPVKFFLPLEAADKAQTNYQRAQLIGMYLADKNCDEMTFAAKNNAAERDAVIAKLAAETNSKMDILATDSIKDMTRGQMIEKTNAIALAGIEEALNSDNADEALVTLTYAVIEGTLNKLAVADLLGEYDQQEVFKSILTHKSMLSNIVELHKILSPAYTSLGEMSELVAKIDAVTQADETRVDGALLAFITYCKEHRGAIAPY
ncbi:MAG: hypothetical protein HUK02_03190 [Bacteroidaceae bacterium]|nr:hypothetical protein [Bacteroidaceae bacterium]